MSTDPYNKSGFMVFIGCMVFTAVFFIYIAFIHPGVKGVDKNLVLDYDPNAPVKSFDLAAVQEPWVSSEDMINAGKKVFTSSTCVTCHGADYKGIAAMNARDLVAGQWKQGGTSVDLYKTITNGIPGTGMASFKHISKNERWALVHLIRSITQNKPADDATTLTNFAKSSEAN